MSQYTCNSAKLNVTSSTHHNIPELEDGMEKYSDIKQYANPMYKDLKFFFNFFNGIAAEIYFH